MHAPAHICRLLGNLHPRLNIRLGWDGTRAPIPGGPMGCFALLQLYHRSDVYTPNGDLKTYGHRWGDIGNYGEDHGTLYSKTGRARPDWNPWERIPIYVLDVPPLWVFDGRIVREVRRWMRPIVSRMHQSAVQHARNVESRVDAITHQAGDDLYRKGQRGVGAPVVARKFITEDATMRRFRAGELDFSKKLPYRPPPGGWDRFLEHDEGDANDLGSVSLKRGA